MLSEEQEEMKAGERAAREMIDRGGSHHHIKKPEPEPPV